MPRPRWVPLFDGERARETRNKQGISLRDLEDRTSKLGERIPFTILCRYEKGEYGPSEQRLRILAAALNTTPNNLLMTDDENRQESA